MAYWDGPWASEDGGAARVQAASGRAPAGALSVVSRDAPGAHMVIVRAVDEVYLYGSTFGAGSTAWVERLDATTLEPIARVDDLAGGPWWPGGIAAHANGSLHVVHGRWAHRLSVDLRPQAARELPQDRAYNSFVVLPDGHLVTKDLVMDGSAPSRLVVLDPDSLEIVGGEVAAPEARSRGSRPTTTSSTSSAITPSSATSGTVVAWPSTAIGRSAIAPRQTSPTDGIR